MCIVQAASEYFYSDIGVKVSPFYETSISQAYERIKASWFGWQNHWSASQKKSCDHWAEYQKQKLHEEGQGAQMREYSISRSVVMAAVHGILIACNHTLSGIWRAH